MTTTQDKYAGSYAPSVTEGLGFSETPQNSSGERPSTSATGGRKNVKNQRFDLIPIDPLTQLAEHYGKGAEKYDNHQWRKGYEWSKSYAALMRHLTAFWNGEDTDEETGSPHMAAAAWHCFTLLQFAKDFPEYDDRYKKPEPEVEDRPGTLPWVDEGWYIPGTKPWLAEYEYTPWKVGDTVTVFPVSVSNFYNEVFADYIEGPEGPASFNLVVRSK